VQRAVLLGAQQTASEVEGRIVANAALRVVGRLDPAEAERAEYGFLGTPIKLIFRQRVSEEAARRTSRPRRVARTSRR